MPIWLRALFAWLVLLGIVLALFLIEGFRHHDFLLAWDILAGSVSLSTVHPGPLGWTLAVFGYLVVPLSIGIVGAALYTARQGRLTKLQADAAVDARIKQWEQLSGLG